MSLRKYFSTILFLVLGGSSLLAKSNQQEDYDWRFFYQKGLQHYDQTRYQTALEFFQRAENLIKRGRIMTNTNSNYSKYKFYMVFTAIANCHANTNQILLAVKYYNISLELQSNQPQLFLYLANYYLKRKRYFQAEEFLKKFYTLKKSNLAVNLQYALVLAQRKKIQLSNNILQEMTNTQSPKIKEVECLQFENDNEYDKARRCYSTLVYMNPQRKDYYFSVIRLASKYKKKYFIPLREIDRYKTIDFSKNFSFNPLKINLIDKYKEFYAKCLYFFWGKEINTRWPYYFSFYRKKMFRRAEHILRDILKNFPQNSFAVLQMSQLKREQNMLIESQRWYQKYKLLIRK